MVDIRLLTLGGREGTDKPARAVSECDRGGQQKLLCFGLALYQPTGIIVENKNLTAKLSPSFF